MTDAQKGAALLGGALLAALLTAGLLFLGPPHNTKSAYVPSGTPAEEAGQAPRAVTDGLGDRSVRLEPPSGERMTLTIPTLPRVDGVPVATAPGTEVGPLRDGAMHVEGTGFPWQDGANVYIAGHRLGFPGTGSDRLFWDLDELATGDRVILEDADGRRYEYAVFRRRVVGPREVWVAQPVPGKSIVSLQTCTLPDYARRLVVQATLVNGPL